MMRTVLSDMAAGTEAASSPQHRPSMHPHMRADKQFHQLLELKLEKDPRKYENAKAVQHMHVATIAIHVLLCVRHGGSSCS